MRKAIERGNTRALNRHYLKAQKKLQKLNDRADVSKQSQRAARLNKLAKAHLKAGIAGVGILGSAAGAQSISRLAAVGLNKKAADASNLAKQSTDYTAKRMYQNAADHYKEMANPFWKTESALYDLSKNSRAIGVAAGVTGAALASSAANKIRSGIAKRRTTPKGHAKAVAERDEFKREMDKAFAKAKNIKPKPKKSLAQRFKNRKYFTNQDFKQAFKAAGLGMVMGPAGANAYLTSKKIANEIPANNNRHGKKRRR